MVFYYFIYSYIIYTCDPLIKKPLLNSLIAMFKPFGFNLVDENLFWLSITANIFQNLIALPLWAFIILAFRWNFKKINPGT